MLPQLIINSHLELSSAERGVCMHAQLLQLCLTLCDSMDCSPPGSFVHEILQARILEWVAIPPPGNLPGPEMEPMSLVPPALADSFFIISTI